jgi:coenzyme PQQ precursor peptide PqqA
MLTSLPAGLAMLLWRPDAGSALSRNRGRRHERETTMAWTTPTLVEICIGLEINGYLPAEF